MGLKKRKGGKEHLEYFMHHTIVKKRGLNIALAKKIQFA